MQVEQLYELIERFTGSELTELEWHKGDEGFTLRRSRVPAPVRDEVCPNEVETQRKPAVSPEGEFLKAPIVGTFYAAPAPGETAFVQPGSRLEQGDTMCLIEAMKMMSEIPAPCPCLVEEVLLEDGSAVGFGQPIFRIRRV